MQDAVPDWVAGHEAGHAVALWALVPPGISGFSRIVVGQSSDTSRFNHLAGFVQIRQYLIKQWQRTKKELAIICLAGQVAEGLFREENLRYWETDIQILFMEGITPEEFLPDTRNLVRQYSREINLIADRLLKVHQMDWFDVVEIIGHPPRFE